MAFRHFDSLPVVISLEQVHFGPALLDLPLPVLLLDTLVLLVEVARCLVAGLQTLNCQALLIKKKIKECRFYVTFH